MFMKRLIQFLSEMSQSWDLDLELFTSVIIGVLYKVITQVQKCRS